MNELDLYQLKNFFVVCNCKSFTKAAEKLFISQSAVSMSIKKLETSIGLTLLDRRTKDLKLTEAGEILYRNCIDIFYGLEKTGERLHHLKENPDFYLNIGATVEFGNTVLIQLIQPFLKKNPALKVNFHFSKNLLMPLLKDDLDLIIDCRNHEQSELKSTFLFRERYICAASPEYLAAQEIASISDFEKSILLSCDSKLQWWNNFFRAAENAITPDQCRQVIRINHIRGLINATVVGMGIGFFPVYTVTRELASGQLKQIFNEIMPRDDIFRIFQKRGRSNRQYQKRVTEFLRNLKPEQLGF